MKWILILWIQSFDTGFPGVEPALWTDVFATQQECVSAGEHDLKVTPLPAYRVKAYSCQVGNVAAEGKEGSHG